MVSHILVLTLCVLSLLQMPPLVVGKPDFGISLAITGSAKVSQAATSAAEVIEAVDDNTDYVAQTAYPALQSLANQLASVATMTVTLGGELVPLVTALVADVSGDVAAAFAPVLDKLGAIRTAIEENLPTANAAIVALVGSFVPDQLTDGFERIVDGLDDLEAQLGALQGAIEAVVTEAGSAADVTEELVKRSVKSVLVYRVVFAVNQLKAFVPVVKYTIDSTLENINLADEYLLLVQQALEGSRDTVDALLTSVTIVTDAIASAVKTDLDEQASEFDEVKSSLSSLAADHSTVSAFLGDYTSTFAGLSATLYPALDGQLSALLEVFSSVASSDSASPVPSSELLDSLILTLIENGGYAQFCFYKYYGLVIGLLTSLADQAGPCFSKEEERLTFLKESLPLFTALLPPDYDNLASELSSCEMLTDPDVLAACINTLSGFYTTLAQEFNAKMQLVFDLIDTETQASGQRFLICIELVKLNLVEISEPALQDEIRQCAIGGPTADDV